MTSEILHVVIDERKNLTHVNHEALMAACREFTAGQGTQRHVFKECILSSEIFYIDSSQS
jgi:hypothetical protein